MSGTSRLENRITDSGRPPDPITANRHVVPPMSATRIVGFEAGGGILVARWLQCGPAIGRSRPIWAAPGRSQFDRRRIVSAWCRGSDELGADLGGVLAQRRH